MPIKAVWQPLLYPAGHKYAGLAATFALCNMLAGCVETLADMNAAESLGAKPSSNQAILAKPALVSLASVDGAPSTIADKFSRILTAEAMGRNISLGDSTSAQYFLRGYLATTASEEGVTLSWVWDVFDSSRRRIQRVADTLDIKGEASSSWSLVTDKALAGVATKSADDLAAILAALPEPAPSSPDATVKPASTPASAVSQPKTGLRGKTALTDNYPVLPRNL